MRRQQGLTQLGRGLSVSLLNSHAFSRAGRLGGESVWGPLSLSSEGVGMTQFLPPLRTGRPHQHHTWSQKAGWPGALSAHTKDNGPFQPQMCPRGLGCSCTLLPATTCPPLSWGCLPSRLAGFRLNRARRRLWASVLRNWGMPSFALKQSPGLIRVAPRPRSPSSLPVSVQSSFPA